MCLAEYSPHVPISSGEHLGIRYHLGVVLHSETCLLTGIVVYTSAQVFLMHTGWLRSKIGLVLSWPRA